jgi:hypothetical protein
MKYKYRDDKNQHTKQAQQAHREFHAIAKKFLTKYRGKFHPDEIKDIMESCISVNTCMENLDLTARLWNN